MAVGIVMGQKIYEAVKAEDLEGIRTLIEIDKEDINQIQNGSG